MTPRPARRTNTAKTTPKRPAAGQRAGGKNPTAGQRPAAGQRSPIKPKRRAEFPWLPVAVGALFAIIGLGLFAYVTAQGSPPKGKDPILCEANQQFAVHYHAHLTILNQGQSMAVPQFTGISTTCFYWLHTHDTSGIIHIEAPAAQANRTFTLGEFFDIWGQPLDSRHVATATAGPGGSLAMFVNGTAYAGDPRAIPLKAHGVITLEITPPKVSPPTFQFPPNT